MALVRCVKHGIKFDDVKRMADGFVLGRNHCPKCEEERDALLEKNRVEEEGKIGRERLERFQANSNIESEYISASFDSFIAETPELKKAVATVKSLIAGEIQKIVMIGSNGTGKTHLACAALNQLQKGKIMSMYEISATIRGTYANNSTVTELQVVDGLARQPCLVIDEMGRTKGSDSEMNWLSYIIDKRHVRGLPTIFISNKHTRKMCPKSGCPDCLENFIGEDIMSRLNEGGRIVKMFGEDYRKKKGR